MAGIITSVKQLVITAVFDEDPPATNELIKVNNRYNTELLVDHIETNGEVYCLNIRDDRRIMKGQRVERLNRSIEIPVW